MKEKGRGEGNDGGSEIARRGVREREIAGELSTSFDGKQALPAIPELRKFARYYGLLRAAVLPAQERIQIPSNVFADRWGTQTSREGDGAGKKSRGRGE